MSIFWPGVIVGPLLVGVCVFAYRKRDALAELVGLSMSRMLPKSLGAKVRGNHEQDVSHLILPIFGGMALGTAIFIFSVTGVMH